jgi:serine/threonine protein phosphatase PrpC
MFYNKYIKYQNKNFRLQLGGENPIVGSSKNQGSREYQEDFIKKIPSLTRSGEEYIILCIFDGHGGKETSKYLSENLFIGCKAQIDELSSPINPEAVKDILIKEYKNLDTRDTPEMKQMYMGSTAAVCVVLDKHIIVSNIADSPIILFKPDGTLIAKSNIHDCNNPLEEARINEDGQFPLCAQISIVDGKPYKRLKHIPESTGLDLTRAFGDIAFKPKSNANPDTYIWPREAGNILCICSDSFLDAKLDGSVSKQTEQDIVNEILAIVNTTVDIGEACELIVQQRGTMKNADNTSMILARL